MKIVTVIQARTGSTRLPNKVLMQVLGKTLLLHQVDRVKSSRFAGTIVVAATSNESDDVIGYLCQRESISCFRGHPTDLLDRHLMAAKLHHADVVVKIPSDCPLIDPDIIDRVIGFYLDNAGLYDYVSNLHPPTYPDGNDVEIMSLQALKRAWKEASRGFEREHTTPYIWENPDKFRIGNVAWETGQDLSLTQRWTLDYPEDYDFIREVYEALYPHKKYFTLQNVLSLINRRPELLKINERYLGVNWYRHHAAELKTISSEYVNQTVA